MTKNYEEMTNTELAKIVDEKVNDFRSKQEVGLDSTVRGFIGEEEYYFGDVYNSGEMTVSKSGEYVNIDESPIRLTSDNPLYRELLLQFVTSPILILESHSIVIDEQE